MRLMLYPLQYSTVQQHPYINFFSERAVWGVGGGVCCQTFFLFYFPCSADHEQDWPPCKVVLFWMATKTLNAKNTRVSSTKNTSCRERRPRLGVYPYYCTPLYYYTVTVVHKLVYFRVRLRLLPKSLDCIGVDWDRMISVFIIISQRKA